MTEPLTHLLGHHLRQTIDKCRPEDSLPGCQKVAQLADMAKSSVVAAIGTSSGGSTAWIATRGQSLISTH